MTGFDLSLTQQNLYLRSPLLLYVRPTNHLVVKTSILLSQKHRHTICLVLARTVLVSRLCPCQSTRVLVRHSVSSICLQLVHQPCWENFFYDE